MPQRTRTAALITTLALFVGALTASTVTATSAADTGNRKPSASFQIASFNVFGSHHTDEPGENTEFASGKERMRKTVRWLNRKGTDLVGLQEPQRDQIRVLTRTGAWDSWPRPGTSKDNQVAQSIAWRTSKFRHVDGYQFRTPFDDNPRDSVSVLLQHRDSGQRFWVLNVHLNTNKVTNPYAKREEGTRRLAEQVNRLKGSGLPVIVTGDMNDKDEFFCRFTRLTTLTSPVGGSNRNGHCQPPHPSRIDWLFGNKRLNWSDFRFAEGGALNKITDHKSVVLATVTLPAIR